MANDDGQSGRSSSGAAASSAAPRTLFITNDFPPRIGGAQSYYWGLVQTLDPSSVTVLAPSHPDASAFDATHAYHVVRAGSSVLWPTPDLLARAAALASEQYADLVQLGHPLPAGLLGPRLKERGLPYVVFLGGAEVTIPGAVPGVNRMLRHVLGQANMLLTVSEYTAGAARRQVRGAVPAEVLRPPIKVDDFAPAADEAEAHELRRRLGIDGRLVVCLGRLVPRKGQDVLIDALALLPPQFADVHLALIGEGRLMTRLYDRAARQGVLDRVHPTGALVDEAVHDWLRAADLFASPVRNRWAGFEVEGFGIVFAEAALSGLPVIAGRSGGSPEAVLEGVSGRVVDGRYPEEVARALAALLQATPQRRREMGLAGRELALSRHTPALVADRYRRLLWQAVAAGV